MATNTIKMVIQFRRDTTANWEQHKHIVPAAGEPCFDIELGTLKIGDGTTSYGELKAIGENGGVAVSADGKSIVLEDGVFKLAGFDAAEVGAQPRKNADGNIEWVVPSTETVEGLQTAVADLSSDVADLKAIVGSAEEGSGTLLSRIEGLEYQVDGTGNGTVDAKIDAKINEFANQISDDGTVNTLKELINYVANHGGEIDTIVSDLSTLQDWVGGAPVHEQIKTAIAGKVDAEDGKSLVADTLIAKLETIDGSAQANVIESIGVGETLLDIVDKRVNIPVATSTTLGVVKGSEEITVAEDGTLSVGVININKIVQDEETILVMDGGSAV